MQKSVVINRTMNTGEMGVLFFLSLLWGASFIFNDVAVSELPTLTVVVVRVFLAAIILLAVMRFAGIKIPMEWRTWRALILLAFINNALPFCLIAWGQFYITAGLASILNATTPLFGVIVAHLFTSDERMTRGRIAGVLTGLTGVVIMVGGEALQELGVNVLAQLAVLAAAFCYAVSGVYARRFHRMGIAPLAIAAGQVTASSAMLIPVMLIVDQPWTLSFPSMQTIGALAGIATLSTALAYILYFRLLETVGATNLLLVTFLIPVTAVGLGIVLLDEMLYTQQIVGMILIGTGLALIDGRLFRLLRHAF